MIDVSKKLKQAREKVNYNQKQLIEWIGKEFNGTVTQSAISQVENGQISTVPEPYLEFLIHHGFDLNSLFNINIEEIVKIGEPYKYRENYEPAIQMMREPSETYGLTKNDKYISFLEATVKDLQADKASLQRTIDQLQEQLKYMRS